MQEELEVLKRDTIIREAAEGLAATQVEKLKKLAEDVDFEDAETFAEKVETIKESYFTKKATGRPFPAGDFHRHFHSSLHQALCVQKAVKKCRKWLIKAPLRIAGTQEIDYMMTSGHAPFSIHDTAPCGKPEFLLTQAMD